MILNEKTTGIRQNSINTLYKLPIFWFFTVISIAPLRQNQLIYWSSVGIVIFVFFIQILHSNLKLNKYLVWMLSFLIVASLSVVWSYQRNLTMDGIKNMLVIAIMYIFISNSIENEKNFYEILRLFVFSKIIMAAFIIISIDLSTLGAMRIGFESLGEQWNANNIGMNMALSSFMTFIILKKENSRRTRVRYYFLILLFGIITLLTGSRKALFVLLFSISLYSVLSARRHKYFKVMLMTIVAILTIYLTMNISFLYNVIGSRLESMLSMFTGQGVIDRSTRIRMEMIEYGKYWFRQKPILGYGLNNYRALYGEVTGNYSYAHNNYVELLVGVGILGTWVYYMGCLYIIKKSIKEQNPLSLFALISILSILLNDIGLVSYDSFYIQFTICMSFTAVRLKTQSNSIHSISDKF